jgi:hypothetical protein
MFTEISDPMFGSMLRRTHSASSTANIFDRVHQWREEFHLAESAGLELNMTETEFILARFEESQTTHVSDQSITI